MVASTAPITANRAMRRSLGAWLDRFSGLNGRPASGDFHDLAAVDCAIEFLGIRAEQDDRIGAQMLFAIGFNLAADLAGVLAAAPFGEPTIATQAVLDKAIEDLDWERERVSRERDVDAH